jgi:hypothetical protein
MIHASLPLIENVRGKVKLGDRLQVTNAPLYAVN